MIVNGLYLGSTPIIRAYKGGELVYERNNKTVTEVFVSPLPVLLETSGEAEMVSGSTAPIAVDSDVLTIDSEVSGWVGTGERATGDWSLEFSSDAEGRAGAGAPGDPLDEGIEITNEAEGRAGAGAPGVCEAWQGEISEEAQADTGVGVPMEGDVFSEVEYECEMGTAQSCSASGATEAQIEAEATVVVVTMPKFADGVLYIPTAYSATLNDGVLEVS